MTVVDKDDKFIFVDLGGNGADAEIWNTCDLNFGFTEDMLPTPPPEPLPFDNEPVLYHLIGDKSFIFATVMMKPFW